MCATPANECARVTSDGGTDPRTGTGTRALRDKTSKTRAARAAHHPALRRRRTLRAAASFALGDSRPAGAPRAPSWSIAGRAWGALRAPPRAACWSIGLSDGRLRAVHCWTQFPKFSKLRPANEHACVQRRRDRRTDGHGYTRAQG